MSSPKEKPRAICKVCSKEFVQSRPWKKYCSASCRWISFKESHGNQKP